MTRFHPRAAAAHPPSAKDDNDKPAPVRDRTGLSALLTAWPTTPKPGPPNTGPLAGSVPSSDSHGGPGSINSDLTRTASHKEARGGPAAIFA